MRQKMRIILSIIALFAMQATYAVNNCLENWICDTAATVSPGTAPSPNVFTICINHTIEWPVIQGGTTDGKKKRTKSCPDSQGLDLVTVPFTFKSWWEDSAGTKINTLTYAFDTGGAFTFTAKAQAVSTEEKSPCQDTAVITVGTITVNVVDLDITFVTSDDYPLFGDETMEFRNITFKTTVPRPFGLTGTMTFTYIWLDGQGNLQSTVQTDDNTGTAVNVFTTIMPAVEYDAPGHSYILPISVEVEFQGCENVSEHLFVEVFQLWIDKFQDKGTGKPWQVVVGRDIEFSANGSINSISWKWDMQDGSPDVWNPINNNAQSGLAMKIPVSDLPEEEDWDWFGDTYGTVDVFCEDAEGSNHSQLSTVAQLNKKAKVYFLHSGTGNPSGKPNWFYYWKEILATGYDINGEADEWGEIDTLVYAGGFGGYGKTGVDIGNSEEARTEIYSDAGKENNGGGSVNKPDLIAWATNAPGAPSSGGGGKATGIGCFLEVLAHESYHKTIYDQNWPNGYDSDDDVDKDLYLDTWENSQQGVNNNFTVHPAPIAPATTSADALDGGAGHIYSEYLCRVVELQAVETEHDDDDWSFSTNPAYQGKNW